MTETNQRNKARAEEFWAAVDAGAPLAGFLHPQVAWQGYAPLPDARGVAEVETRLAILREAFAGAERQMHILMGGASSGRADGGTDGAMWVGATGYLSGAQTTEFLGIPAAPAPVRLRWSDFLEFDAAGRITRIQSLIDVIDWLEQRDLSPLPQARGVPHVYPAPTGSDGVLTGPQDAARSADTLRFARSFIFDGLNAFDESELSSMGMADYFHPNLKWYGPGGIGACLSLAEFEDLHQRPWLVAFPDRKVGDLDNLIAEGDYVGASSLPGVWLTHSGPYLGYPGEGARAGVNGIDFWLRQGDQFVENWVFVDMLHLFSQFGVDLLARARHMAGAS